MGIDVELGKRFHRQFLYWAHHLLVEETVSPRIVMAFGGWSSYDAIEPDLAAPIEENIIASMASMDL